jgi:hypothetical protein
LTSVESEGSEEMGFGLAARERNSGAAVAE